MTVPSTAADSPAPDASRYFRSESQIAWLTPVLGILAALPVAYWYQWRFAVGIFVGSILAWLNFRWLKKGLYALTESATAQAGQPKPQVPIGV
jgi:hypothetical protein